MILALLIIASIEFIGLLILSVKLRYRKFDGSMMVYDTDDKKTFSLEIDGDPDKLDEKKQIVLKVTKPQE